MEENQRPVKISLGMRLRLARVSSRMSQSELGRWVYLDRRVLSSYEMDRHEPSFGTVVRIARATKRSLDWFAGND